MSTNAEFSTARTNELLEEIGGGTTLVSGKPAVTANSAYASGNLVGVPFQLLTPPKSGLLQNAHLRCKASIQTAEFRAYLFSNNPTATSWVNKSSAAIINATDVPLIVGCLAFVAPYSDLGTHTYYGLNGIGKRMRLTNGLWCALVTKGAPTFLATDDISLELLFTPDAL